MYRAAGPGPHPAILYLHGGALIFGERAWISEAEVEVYLNAGYTVVTADYRLAPETKLETILEDVQDAYQWLVRQGPTLFNIDPSRIAVIGPSAGGYLTLLMGPPCPSTPACAGVVLRPMAISSAIGIPALTPIIPSSHASVRRKLAGVVGTAPLAGERWGALHVLSLHAPEWGMGEGSGRA